MKEGITATIVAISSLRLDFKAGAVAVVAAGRVKNKASVQQQSCLHKIQVEQVITTMFVSSRFDCHASTHSPITNILATSMDPFIFTGATKSCSSSIRITIGTLRRYWEVVEIENYRYSDPYTLYYYYCTEEKF